MRECLTYAEPLSKANLPILYDVAHLAGEVGVEEQHLRKILEKPASCYVRFFVPKRTGGYRRISEPVWPLNAIQRWILRQILDKRSPHRAANAFTRGRSIKTNATPHIGRQMVLSLDVMDFFDSIKPSQVRHVFRMMGYASEVSGALTRLTTLLGGLPQGGPASPALSNLVMFDVDESLMQYAHANSIHYTRYADDITFSGIFKVGNAIRTTTDVLSKVGLELNTEKTRLMLPHQQQEVTGVVVNKYMQAPRSLRRALRQEIYYLTKHGLDEHCSRKFSLHRNRLDHLRGIAEFILFLNPEDRDAKAAINAIGRIRY